jgi:hypothetical protein
LEENNTLPETLNFSHLIEGLEPRDLDFVLVENGRFWMGQMSLTVKRIPKKNPYIKWK